MNGIEGETHAYNGTDYTYYGPADCEIVENAAGTVVTRERISASVLFIESTPL